MKNTGIVLIAIGLALLIAGLIWPSQANEQKNFIKAAVDMEDVVRQGQDPSKGEVDRQTDQSVAVFRDKLEVSAYHFIAAGVLTALVGLALTVIGIARTSNRA